MCLFKIFLMIFMFAFSVCELLCDVRWSCSRLHAKQTHALLAFIVSNVQLE